MQKFYLLAEKTSVIGSLRMHFSYDKQRTVDKGLSGEAKHMPGSELC